MRGRNVRRQRAGDWRRGGEGGGQRCAGSTRAAPALKLKAAELLAGLYSSGRSRALPAGCGLSSNGWLLPPGPAPAPGLASAQRGSACGLPSRASARREGLLTGLPRRVAARLEGLSKGEPAAWRAVLGCQTRPRGEGGGDAETRGEVAGVAVVCSQCHSPPAGRCAPDLRSLGPRRASRCGGCCTSLPGATGGRVQTPGAACSIAHRCRRGRAGAAAACPPRTSGVGRCRRCHAELMAHSDCAAAAASPVARAGGGGGGRMSCRASHGCRPPGCRPMRGDRARAPATPLPRASCQGGR